MAAPFLPARVLRTAAKRRLAAPLRRRRSRHLRYLAGSVNPTPAASSVALVAYGYARSLRPCDARFSPSENAICSGGDR